MFIERPLTTPLAEHKMHDELADPFRILPFPIGQVALVRKKAYIKRTPTHASSCLHRMLVYIIFAPIPS
jgi:hypothetical protein